MSVVNDTDRWTCGKQVLTIEDLRRLPLETIAINLCLKAMATLILVIKLYLLL